MIIFKQFYPRCHPIYCCTPANIWYTIYTWF